MNYSICQKADILDGRAVVLLLMKMDGIHI